MSGASLRAQALSVLAIADPDSKTAAALAIDRDADAGEAELIESRVALPGRLDRPRLVAPSKLRQRPLGRVEGRAALLHALAHIELNAVNLALDIAWRFAGLPAGFYRDWIGVAREEAIHFGLLRDRLSELGGEYGQMPAHDGLWEMAERTRGDALARLALVPRTLEARGLDVSPGIRARLAAAGDLASAAILDRILADEIGHVAIGNRWYRWLCAERGIEPMAAAAALAIQYRAAPPRGPFNLAARREAGFDEAELAALEASERRSR